MTRLGNFEKFLATNFHVKVAKTFGNFLGHFEILHFQLKAAVAAFWATFGNIRTNFSPSGHKESTINSAKLDLPQLETQ